MTSQAEKTTLRIAVAQLNPTVGDVTGNLAKARAAREDAARQGADLLLLTELFISGYPPEDLVLKPAFLKACRRAVDDLAADPAEHPELRVVSARSRWRVGDMLHELLDGGPWHRTIRVPRDVAPRVILGLV